MRGTKPTVALALALLAAGAASAQAADSRAVHIPGVSKAAFWTNAPLAWEASPTGMVVVAGPKTDKYNSPDESNVSDTAPRLLFDADRDFIFSAGVGHAFASVWDSGGLIVEADRAHWFKLNFERDYTGARRIVSVVTRDYSDDSNAMELDADVAFLEVAKRDDAFYLFVSKDGAGWYLLRAFNMKTQGPLKVGLIAQSPSGDRARITFTDIRYSATRINDIWKGK